MEFVGYRLQSLREERGLSKYGLARMAGIDQKTVTRLEAGENQPIKRTVGALAKALKTSPSFFYRDDSGTFAHLIKPAPIPQPESVKARLGEFALISLGAGLIVGLVMFAIIYAGA